MKKPRQVPQGKRTNGAPKKRRPLATAGQKEGIARFYRGLSTGTAFVALLGFVMGRASILGVLWPFGIAFYAALLAVVPKAAALSAVAVVLGAVSQRNPGHIATTIVAMLLLNSVSASLHQKPGGSRTLTIALTAAALNLGGRVIFLAVTQAAPYAYLMAMVEALAVTGLAAAYICALPLLEERTRKYRQEELASVCILLASAVAGVSELRVGPVEMRNIVGSFITLSVAHAGGPSLGSAAGVSVGSLIALSRPLVPTAVGVQALGGLASGLFKGTGKIGTAVGFLLGAIALRLPTETSTGLTQMIIEIGIATVGFTFISLPAGIRDVFGEHKVQPQSSLAQGSKIQEIVAARLHEFARVLRELSRSYTHIAATADREKDLSVHLDRAIKRACEGCGQQGQCFDGSFAKRYSAVADLLQAVGSKATLSTREIPEQWRDNCPRLIEMITQVTFVAEMQNISRVSASRLGEMRNVLANQIKGISAVLDTLASEVRAMPKPRERIRQIDYEISIARRAKQGSIMCGDSALHKETKDNKLVLILSDGMGSGPSAALESKATVALLEQLLDNGFDPELAVDTVNNFMRLKFPDETFATVDMALVDLITGDAEFLKRSAAPSFIKREGEVTVLTASSLPIGILGQAEADRSRKLVKQGDVLVMITDGAMQWVRAARKDEPFAGYLSRQRLAHADEIAGRLLDKVLETGKDELKDDVTIMVVRFLPGGPSRAQPA